MLGNNQAANAGHPGYVSGKWYAPPLIGYAQAGAVLANGSVRMVPFYLTKQIRISDLGCRITTLAAAGNIRLGIYRGDATTGLPTGTAAVETGNISTAATGALSASVTAATLAPGLCFMAVNADNATVVLQCLYSGFTSPTAIVGSGTLATLTSAATTTVIVYTFASAFGAFPDLTGQTIVEAAPSNGWGLVFMKAA